jgi:hypothetical protein
MPSHQHWYCWQVGLDKQTSTKCKSKLQFGLDKQTSTIVQNFNNNILI